MPNILAIQEAHDASAALMIDGRIVAAAQEERFTGLKGDYGFPSKAIQSCLHSAGITSADLDQVILCSHKWNPVLTKIKRNANFKVSDWVREQQDYWKPTLLEGKKVCYYDIFKDRDDFRYDNSYSFDGLLQGYMDKDEMHKMALVRKEHAARNLNIDLHKIETMLHEDCHVYYAYYSNPKRGNNLMLTAEGIGDYSNGTVSLFEDMQKKELSNTNQNHIGHIYQYITLILGMKPGQHEYKVMGLAPYANRYEVQKSFKVFKDVLKVSGLDIVFDKRPDDLYFSFRDALEGHRFDGVAGAVQLFAEKLLCEWTKNCVEHTGVSSVCFSGGVAQNIKAAKSMSELQCVDSMYVPPAAGDTSLPIGACYWAMHQHIAANGGDFSDIKPLDTLYLGPEYSKQQILEAIRQTGAADRYLIRHDFSPADCASLLAKGKVIARCSGRMEFGLRALGNRSILADPRDPNTVKRINRAIKFRDFWMPFTPTILAERENDYVVNPKKLSSPFMTMAFESTAKAVKEIPATLHPADGTLRPQILNRNQNDEYYAIIHEFERITGVGALLNTSFNLHGDPIVLGPYEAIRTLDGSDLDGLMMGDVFLQKKD